MQKSAAKISLYIIIALIMLSAGFVIYKQQNSHPTGQAPVNETACGDRFNYGECVRDEDCIEVSYDGCCLDHRLINKKYLEKYQASHEAQSAEPEECSSIECDETDTSTSTIVCAFAGGESKQCMYAHERDAALSESFYARFPIVNKEIVCYKDCREGGLDVVFYVTGEENMRRFADSQMDLGELKGDFSDIQNLVIAVYSEETCGDNCFQTYWVRENDWLIQSNKYGFMEHIMKYDTDTRVMRRE